MFFLAALSSLLRLIKDKIKRIIIINPKILIPINIFFLLHFLLVFFVFTSCALSGGDWGMLSCFVFGALTSALLRAESGGIFKTVGLDIGECTLFSFVVFTALTSASSRTAF